MAAILQPRALAQRLIQSSALALICNGVSINIDARTGIFVYPPHGKRLSC